jgi:RNA polymerase sigma-70 factor (ECF subfamily)
MNPPAADEQDARDMARLAGGHDAALNDLMNRHAEKLFHYLLRSLQDPDDAADLAQETFARVYQSRDKYDPAQKFATWLYAISSNLVRGRYRWRARHPQVSLDAESTGTGGPLAERLMDDQASPSERLALSEQAQAVRRAVAALPEELRTPLILAEYEDRSQAEIGEILGCSAKAVEMRIYRARKQLRESLGALAGQT